VFSKYGVIRIVKDKRVKIKTYGCAIVTWYDDADAVDVC
jgi:inorganic pyrophosphatase